jgi:hypothetical protein
VLNVLAEMEGKSSTPALLAALYWAPSRVEQSDSMMKQSWVCALSMAVPAIVSAQTGGPYARIAVLRPQGGEAAKFEAGYVRHLDWHRRAGDRWYGWTIWSGDRQRWFVYATFGHAASDFDHAVSPAEDERDNLLNVEPHVEWVTNGLFQFLPGLSRGSGTPTATPRLEYTSVELTPGSDEAFEAALASVRPGLMGETLWYRVVAGGPVPRYIRLRPLPAVAALLDRPTPSSPRRSRRRLGPSPRGAIRRFLEAQRKHHGPLRHRWRSSSVGRPAFMPPAEPRPQAAGHSPIRAQPLARSSHVTAPSCC